MQTTSALYDSYANSNMRPISWAFRASWDKAFDPSVIFFELDTSLLDGPNVLAPSDNNVVQEWDKYIYADYTDRVVAMEWTREEQIPYSVNLAMADIDLNNYDDLFTYGAGGALDSYILPGRPIRILAGFGNINLPQFVGLTEKVPMADYKQKTAQIHATDFLSFIFNKPIDQATIFTDVKTDVILDELFQLVGLTPSQYVLDNSINEIAFAYFEKGTKLGEAVKSLMQAELGSLYMDEFGIIRFKNRTRGNTAPVISFNEKTIDEYTISNEDTIINVVEVSAKVREVQPTELVFDLSEAILVPASGTAERFFNFENPVTTFETITSYTANSAADGSGSDQTPNLSITGTDLFTTSVKVEFTNSSGADIYVTELLLYGTPAKVTKEIFVRQQDQTSIDAFNERILQIDNDYIQTVDAANSLALTLINYYKNYLNTIEIQVKGNHALQINDVMSVSVGNADGDYVITKIESRLADGNFTQRITGKIFDIPTLFILDQSLLDGPDVLSP